MGAYGQTLSKAWWNVAVVLLTWYTTSDTSERMWLKADELWLMTPKPILPWKYSGATTAAGKI